MSWVRPKISVIVPIYNVETYLAECLDSLRDQTLSDIEVLCISDGSTDGSEAIVARYAATDERFRLIRKVNLGYGHTMNLGLDNARGEYVSFVESDDYVMPDMYENLYRQAKEHDVDIIKANYCEFAGNPPTVKRKRLTDPARYNKVVRPLDEPWTFYIPMMNCLGLFSNDFLTSNRIRHNETPGASHQDMGFWFQTLCLAQRFMLVEGHYYMYRQDNPNSSINQKNKVFCVSDEYQFMFRFLQRHLDLLDQAYPIYYHRLFGSYSYRYMNLVPKFHLMFLRRFSDEMRRARDCGALDTSRFNPSELQAISLLIEDPEAYWRQIDSPEMLAVEQEGFDGPLAVAASKEAFFVPTAETRPARAAKEDREYVEGLISVIIPVYNTAEYLPACLDRIVNQTHRLLEVICIDDGSTDGSLDVLNRYAALDSRICVVSQANAGQACARNVGIGMARGEYIYFMDSDDVLDRDALETLYGIASGDGLDMVFFDADTYFDDESLVDTHKSYIGNYRRPFDLGDGVTGAELFVAFKKQKSYRVSPCLYLVRAALLHDAGILYTEGVIYEDNIFTLKCILEARRVSHVARPFYTRRIRSGSTVTRDVSFRNFYGYFICYLEIADYLYGKEFDFETWQQVLDELRLIYRQAWSFYNKLAPSEKSKVKAMPAFQLACFERLFRTGGSTCGCGYDPERELELVKSSLSFKIGQAVTWLPRKIRTCKERA